jgi:two-component system chemotaxis response regulator CheB
MSVRVLIADDAILFRRVLTDALGSLPDVEVVGSAPNGRLALQRIHELKPDLVTLDLEMPEMDGLAVLDALRASGSRLPVIVVSALTRRGGELTLRALEKGAFDFITKPDTSGAEASREAVRRELAPRVRALAHRLAIRNILRPGAGNTPTAPPNGAHTRPATHVPHAPTSRPGSTATPAPAQAPDLGGIAGRMQRLTTPPGRPELILIGVSTGGPNALAQLLPQIPRDLGLPILIVQHMPPVFTQALAESLAGKCPFRVREAAHGDVVAPNTAYIAPGGRQLRLAGSTDGQRILQVTDDPPENNCRPAVDYLFRSAASVAPGRSMAVILTGMGSDGTIGLRLLKRHGCFVIAQDEASCVVYGMPKAAVEAGVVDAVLPLDSIAARIASTVRGPRT